MKIIKLFRGEECFVDDEDYEEINKSKWRITPYGYARSTVRGFMHRVIMKAKDGEMIDHINRNRLDNRKSNLRFASYSENASNKTPNLNCSSIYKGVTYNKKPNNYYVKIKFKRKVFNLGFYKNEVVAAYVYNKKAKELSDFFLLNTLDICDDVLEKMLEDEERIKKMERGSIQYQKIDKIWTVRISHNYKRVFLGSYKTEELAIKRLEEVKEKIENGNTEDLEPKVNKGGVNWNVNKKRWVARITIDNKRICLGCFKVKEDAIKKLEEEREKLKTQYIKKMKNILEVKWKVSECGNSDCWCRIIEPEEKIIDENKFEVTVIDAGSINKEIADHIVKLHNDSLK